MGKKPSFKNNFAVSEIVGGMFMIIIAVVAFASIYMYLYPPGPDLEVSTKLVGYVDNQGMIVLSHKGGDTLSNYKVVIRYPNGSLIGEKTINDDEWKIGQIRFPLSQLSITDLRLVNETIKVDLNIYTIKRDGSSEEVFNARLKGKVLGSTNKILEKDLMLITSLHTESTDEDIICFNHSVNTTLNVTSYIFKWLLNGQSFARILMPFDVENSTTAKDYADNSIDGAVSGAVWNDSGLVGGCYDFDGAGDSIDTNEVPPMYQDISRGDFTLSIWINSYDVRDDLNVIFEVCDNYPGFKNYVRLFQYGKEIHMAVLETNTMHVVRTDEIENNTWYHIAGTWDASTKEAAIHINGVKSTKIGNRAISFGAKDGMSLGHGSSSTPFWYGQLDELQIFDRVLSDEQIYYLYLTQKYSEQNMSIVSSQETLTGELWQCIIIPTDGVQEDTPWESNLLQIISYGGGD